MGGAWYLAPTTTNTTSSLIDSARLDPWCLLSSVINYLHPTTSNPSRPETSPHSTSTSTINPSGPETSTSPTSTSIIKPTSSTTPTTPVTPTTPTTSTPSNIQPFSLLLSFPPELRLQIYTHALLPSPTNLALLRTSPQINMEAQSTLYNRHVHFPSQNHLFAWLERSLPVHLRSVRTLSLQITDVDLTPLFLTNANAANTTRASAWTLYHRELQRLDAALLSLPYLSELTLTPPRGNCASQLLRGMYLSFLALVALRCPGLENLILNDREEVLGKVGALGRLPRVTFGVASSSSTSTMRESGGGSGLMVGVGGGEKKMVLPFMLKRDRVGGGYSSMKCERTMRGVKAERV